MVDFVCVTGLRTDVGFYYSRPASIFGPTPLFLVRRVFRRGGFACAHALPCSLAGRLGGSSVRVPFPVHPLCLDSHAVHNLFVYLGYA